MLKVIYNDAPEQITYGTQGKLHSPHWTIRVTEAIATLSDPKLNRLVRFYTRRDDRQGSDGRTYYELRESSTKAKILLEGLPGEISVTVLDLAHIEPGQYEKASHHDLRASRVFAKTDEGIREAAEFCAQAFSQETTYSKGAFRRIGLTLNKAMVDHSKNVFLGGRVVTLTQDLNAKDERGNFRTVVQVCNNLDDKRKLLEIYYPRFDLRRKNEVELFCNGYYLVHKSSTEYVFCSPSAFKHYYELIEGSKIGKLLWRFFDTPKLQAAQA